MSEKKIDTNQAIKILTEQIDKLNTISTFNNGVWRFQTISYIELFFSKESAEYRYINQTDFAVETAYSTPGDIAQLVSRHKESAKHFLINCIDTLRIKGIYKPEKINFLYRIKGATLLTVIIFTIPGLLGIGTLWGKYLSDTQNVELKIEVKDLKSEIEKLKSPLPKQAEAIPKNAGDSASGK